MAIIALVRLGPRNAASAIARIRNGHARKASVSREIKPTDPAALEQLASIYADRSDAAGLDPIAETLQRQFPERAMTPYYAAASSFLHERFPAALDFARHAVERDPRRAAAHNLLSDGQGISVGRGRDQGNRFLSFNRLRNVTADEQTTEYQTNQHHVNDSRDCYAVGAIVVVLSPDLIRC